MGDLRGPLSVPSGIAIAEEINHVRGRKTTVIENPGRRLLYLECERGEYRIRSGDISHGDMPDESIPDDDVTDGTGSLSLQDGQVRIISPAPDEITVRGLHRRSILTYYFV